MVRLKGRERQAEGKETRFQYLLVRLKAISGNNLIITPLFQYLLVRLKDKSFKELRENKKFQYLLVRLKENKKNNSEMKKKISIPLGTIKRAFLFVIPLS